MLVQIGNGILKIILVQAVMSPGLEIDAILVEFLQHRSDEVMETTGTTVDPIPDGVG
jgi:hypothetical protein